MNYLSADNTPNGQDFCVLDFANPEDIDYHFLPMLYVEKYKYPGVVLQIGRVTLQVPLDWSIIVSEEGSIEVVPVQQLNDRDFSAFIFNPISGYIPRTEVVEIIDIVKVKEWTVPKLKKSCIICVPLEKKEKPLCIYLTGPSFHEQIDLTHFI